MRPLVELIDQQDPALPLIQTWAQEADLNVELLAPSSERDTVLLDLQVTTRSPLGAIAHDTGGILIDGGWLRMLGSGHARLGRDLSGWNRDRANGFLLVADDVVGGFFAINGGGLGDDRGAIHYFAPDTLAWESLEVGHTAFVQWAFSERLREFYGDSYWTGWESDVAALGGDACFGFYPFLFTREGSTQASSRRPLSVGEQYAFSVSGEKSPT
ncbi:DUF2625 domain-containing protein [Diaphorobacter sp. HDW4A]|uniref:DUF2625 domain-containing protein n=1 Tax=Diaphorobacter sp. HDW4A TaxID=2714924 RepID=UPI00140B88A5|nr:DUF2625 domain-containing protein [Diaphorobacter sp. HDW4A]QIL79692.1 DUF2625 domain-containing protein [Diaphorobacter sp. HDW4A]